ncbi:polysaccharide biosynthesis protein [candidate division bacterium WOR-3 4484_18]|uniref:Polysaccharide biosynthesis protein n=1 Tax=candidate division WOR-3 bacterium 4484_18 TaxID=2020626 RepID=A0A257LUL8_UNCW3|nr:MAG: polysaccharide biosynthesis protein [candidate division bacterium WOR-3 4484_18]
MQNEVYARLPSLRVNFLWVATGRAIFAITQWGIISALSKLGTPVLVGEYTLGLAISAPIFMFMSLQLRSVQAIDARGEYSLSHFLNLRCITNVVSLFMIALVSRLMGYSGHLWVIIIAVGGMKFMEYMSDVLYGCMQKHERVDLMAKSLILRGTGGLGFFVLMLLLCKSLLWAIIGVAAVWLAIFVIFDLTNAKSLESFKLPHDWSKLWTLFRLSLPLGIVMGIVSLNTNIPRYFIERFHGTAMLGYFSALAYIPTAGNIVIVALGQAAIARLAKYYAFDKEGKAYVRLLLRLVLLATLIGGAGVVIVWLFGPQILRVVYKADYARYHRELIWLMVSGVIWFVASILNQGMTAARQFKIQVLIFLIVLATSVVGSLWFIPRYGLMGAVHVRIISNSVMVVGAAAVNLYAVKKKK